MCKLHQGKRWTLRKIEDLVHRGINVLPEVCFVCLLVFPRALRQGPISIANFWVFLERKRARVTIRMKMLWWLVSVSAIPAMSLGIHQECVQVLFLSRQKPIFVPSSVVGSSFWGLGRWSTPGDYTSRGGVDKFFFLFVLGCL